MPPRAHTPRRAHRPPEPPKSALVLAGVGCVSMERQSSQPVHTELHSGCEAPAAHRRTSSRTSSKPSVPPGRPPKQPSPLQHPPPRRQSTKEEGSQRSSSRASRSSSRPRSQGTSAGPASRASTASRDSRQGLELSMAMPSGASAGLVEVPVGDDGTTLVAMEYRPPPGVRIIGLVLLAPGSNGGMGPGIAPKHAGLPLEKSTSLAAYGSLFRRFGQEAASGVSHGWDGKVSSDDASKDTMDTTGTAFAHRRCRERSTSKPRTGIVVLQMTWHQCKNGVIWPGRKLRRVDSLRSAVADMVAAARFLRASVSTDVSPSPLPLALVGMSFGGPAMWAAAAKILRTPELGPLCGVVSVAGSGRGGAAFETELMDTQGAVSACSAAGVPALFLHGTEDTNVPLPVATYFYNVSQATAAAGQSIHTLAVIPGATHLLSEARDKAYMVFHDWLMAKVSLAHKPEPPTAVGGVRARVLHVPRLLPAIGPGAYMVRRRLGEVNFEAFTPQAVSRESLLPLSVRGYSEKDIELAKVQIKQLPVAVEPEAKSETSSEGSCDEDEDLELPVAN